MKKLKSDQCHAQTDGDDEKEESSSEEEHKIVVGYALTAKKIKSFLKPSLIRMARSKGIAFVPIDVDKPLSDQGPFSIILHKIEGKEWAESLESVKPGVIVLDPPCAIQRVRNRQLMLEVISELNLPDVSVSVPKQVVISENPTTTIQDEVTEAGLQFPLVVKPLIVDDTAKSHKLSIAHNLDCLSVVDIPFVLQEFISHDAVVFKIYVVGTTNRLVKRSSLHEACKLDDGTGLWPLERVSCASVSQDLDQDAFAIQPPPQTLIDALARELHQKLGLQLFNMDMIRSAGTNVYYVIDINYFPGYGKVPGYERIFTDFFLNLVQGK